MRGIILFAYSLLFSTSSFSQNKIDDYDSILNNNLLESLQKYDAVNGLAILVKAQSGEILAVSGYEKRNGKYIKEF